MKGEMATLAARAAERFGDRTVLKLLGDGAKASFAEVDAKAGRFASALKARGVATGDRVVIHLPNGVDWLIAYHGAARLGAVVAPANFLLTADEVAYIAADSEARTVVLPVDRQEAMGEALRRVNAQADLIAADPSRGLNDAMGADSVAATAVAADDLFTIGYTSGTTGRPKGAMLSHGAVFTSVAMTAMFHQRRAEDRVFTALPFPHVYGNVVMNAAFHCGYQLIVPPRFDAGAAIAAIGREGVTLFEGVPTMFYQMMAHPEIAGGDYRTLERCTVGGQTMPASSLAEASRRFGCPILELWGMTEVAGPATSHSPHFPPVLGSIGLPFPGLEIRLMSVTHPGQLAADGENGQLQVRGPQVTSGYWRNETATRELLSSDGWLSTGDVAVRRDDGYLFIVDRLKDMIITGGYNIYPAELEQVLAGHPAVAMVAVASVADAEKGELAKAFVVLRPGLRCDQEELAAHCRKHLAPYKVPRQFAFVDDLPKTSTGKILRRALRDTAATVTPQPRTVS